MVSQVFLGMVGPNQMIIVLVIALLIFGGKKIPELMKGLGSGIKEFKNATKEEEEPVVASKENKINELEKEVQRLKENDKNSSS